MEGDAMEQNDEEIEMLQVAEPSLTDLEESYLIEAFRSTFISGSMGPFIDRFESTFAPLAGCKYGVALANGTVAIHLLMKCLGLEQGEEVLMPDWNYVANAAATVSAGGVPVLVDCDEWGCIDPIAIRAAVKPGVTRFLWVVHLYGHPCDMDAICKVADDLELTILEDCAEAHGATYKDRPVGSFGRASTFSFYGNKIFTTGEGGLICTNDKDLAARARHLSRHAASPTKRFLHTDVGFNYRMSNLLCAVGCAQIERAEELFKGRRELIEYYRDSLEGVCGGVRISPKSSDHIVVSPWLACVVLPESLAHHRDHICNILRSEFRVDTRPFFPPIHTMVPYSGYVTASRSGRGCKNLGALRMGMIGFNIPTSSNMSQQNRSRVVKAVLETLNRF